MLRMAGSRNNGRVPSHDWLPELATISTGCKGQSTLNGTLTMGETIKVRCKNTCMAPAASDETANRDRLDSPGTCVANKMETVYASNVVAVGQTAARNTLAVATGDAFVACKMCTGSGVGHFIALGFSGSGKLTGNEGIG